MSSLWWVVSVALNRERRGLGIELSRCKSWPNRFGRVAERNHHGRKIVKHRATGTYNRSMAYAHAGSYEHIGCNPGFVLDEDWFVIDVEAWALHIVRSGAEIRTLRHHDVRSDMNFSQTVKGHIVADPGIVANGNFPGIGNVGRGAYQHTLPDGASEETE